MTDLTFSPDETPPVTSFRAGTGSLPAVFGALAAALTAFETLIGFEQLEATDVEHIEWILLAEGGPWGQPVQDLAPFSEPDSDAEEHP